MTLMPEVHDATKEALRRRTRIRRQRLRLPLAVAAVLATGATAAVAATSWWPVLGDEDRGNPTVAASQLPASQPAALRVLRRDQDEGDRSPAVQALLRRLAAREAGGVQVAGIRLLDRRPNGITILVPVERAGTADPGYPPSVKRDALCVLYDSPVGTAQKCGTSEELDDGRIAGAMNAGNGTISLFGLVPDGVQRVRATLRDGTVLTNTVKNNLYDLPLGAGPRALGGVSVEWLDASGTATAKPAD